MGLTLNTTLAVGLSLLSYFFVRLWTVRRLFVKLRRRGMPMPEHSLFFGHLLSLKPLMDSLPVDAHINVVMNELVKEPGLSPVFYLDLWPISPPIMVITSTTASMQVTQLYNLPKPEALTTLLLPMTGGPSIFTMKEEQWKPWRTIFNPGFSERNLLKHVPDLIEEVEVYCDMLRKYAGAEEIFKLDEKTLWLTMDIITRVCLDNRIHSQTTRNPLASAFRSQVKWLTFGNEMNPWNRWHPMRPIMQKWNSYIMDKYITSELEERFEERQKNLNHKESKHSKSVIDLALEAYMTDHASGDSSGTLDRTFRTHATSQIRLFLFAGHDTTSSTICYCYYLLQAHPSCLDRLRTEHDIVFGKDVSRTAQVLREQPQLLNRIPYTLAVIKETMRLFPAASSMRTGAAGIFVTDEEGNKYDTEGMLPWVVHMALQRSPKYWKEPDSFLPDRWLVEPGHPLYPVKGAWRPFEYGPRNCIGQALVMLDIRLVLVMTMREFDIRESYDEWDDLHRTKKTKTVKGERVYQIESGGAHPADGFPCRVFIRK